MDKWRRHAAERSRIVYANNSTRDRVEYIPCSSSLCISRNFQLAKREKYDRKGRRNHRSFFCLRMDEETWLIRLHLGKFCSAFSVKNASLSFDRPSLPSYLAPVKKRRSPFAATSRPNVWNDGLRETLDESSCSFPRQ